MTKKNVLLITDEIVVGGPSTLHCELIRSLLKRSNKVTLLTFFDSISGKNQRYSRFEQYFAFEVKRLFSFFSIPHRVKIMRAFFQKFNPADFDVVIIDMLSALLCYRLVTLFVNKKNQSKLIFLFHGSEYFQFIFGHRTKPIGRSLILFFLEKKLYNSVDRLITVSKYAKTILTDHLRVNHNLVKVLRPGTESVFSSVKDRFDKKQARKLLGLHPDINLIMCAGRNEPRKGIDKFAITFSENMQKLGKDVFLLIATDYSQHEGQMLLATVKSYKSSVGKILFFHNPSRLELALLYKSSDCVVIPSLDLETFGFVTFEAIQTGALVTGFDIGANKNLIAGSNLVKLNKDNVELSFRELIGLTIHMLKEPGKHANKKVKLNQYKWDNWSNCILTSLRIPNHI